MSTVGIYDADFMKYEQVIPNLECAKISSYLKNKNEIAVLTPNLEPEHYTHFYVRKEYDDGYYPQQYFNKNVNYGGRAFSPEKYIPLDINIEHATPDFYCYEKYAAYYGHTIESQHQFKRILNSQHIRLSLDGTNLDEYSFNKIKDSIGSNTRGLILHDYEPAKIKNLFEIVQELSKVRKTLDGRDKDMPIGNKYPIDIYSSEELYKWIDIYPMTGVFFFKFHGLIKNEVLNEMIKKNPQFCRQIYYIVDDGCKDENDFLMNRAPEIYKQILFCKRTNTKILLKYNDDFFVTPELEKFIILLNCYSNHKWQESYMSNTQTLYKFCSSKPQRKYRDLLLYQNIINQYDMRDIFQYIRIHNYELFKMFYEWDDVSYEGGQIKNEWRRNS